MKCLVFQHVPHEHPGLLAEAAKERGVALEVVELWKEGYVIPAAENYDALIIMGGPMGVYENYPSEADEVSFIRANLGTLPMIGFCLGSQLIAHALGAKVYPNEREGRRVKEIGFYDVELTAAGAADPLFQGFDSPIKVLQWHGDAFDLPSGATLLATSPLCANQAFRYGSNVYGMLFHNEFTPQMIDFQIQNDKDWIHKDFDMDEDKLKAEASKYAEQMKRQCAQLFKNFSKIVTRP